MPAFCRLAAQCRCGRRQRHLISPIGCQRGPLHAFVSWGGGGARHLDRVRRGDWRRNRPIGTSGQPSSCAEPGGNLGAAGYEAPSSGGHVPYSGERGRPSQLQVRCGAGWGAVRPAGRPVGDLTKPRPPLPRRRDGRTRGCALAPSSLSAEGLRCAVPHFSPLARRKNTGRVVCCFGTGSCGAPSWSLCWRLARWWTGLGGKSPS